MYKHKLLTLEVNIEVSYIQTFLFNKIGNRALQTNSRLLANFRALIG